jgi:hypothetical protein
MKLFFCFGKKIKNSQKINYKTNNKNTVINPIYIEEEEPPPKIKLNRKSKEEYCTDATEFLKDLDHFLDSS